MKLVPLQLFCRISPSAPVALAACQRFIRDTDPDTRKAGEPMIAATRATRQRMGENILIPAPNRRNDGACNAAAQEGKSYRRTDGVGGTVPGPTGEELARYLDRNGVPSEPITVQPESRSTGEAILAVRSRLVLE